MKNKKLSFESYKYLLDLINDSHRSVITFEDLLNGNNGIILRHDIDFCPKLAFKIAKIENKNNIKSIFFVLINSSIYNFKEPSNLSMIKNIILLGHEIGLHFDSSLYNKEDIDKACETECKILENVINNSVNIVSFHRPEQKLLGLNNKIANRNHTYMPKFIKEIKYCSDSGGEWKYDDPEDLINDRSIKNIQLLTHPIWWTTPENLTPGEKVFYHVKEKDKLIQKAAAKNCLPFKNFIEARKNQVEG